MTRETERIPMSQCELHRYRTLRLVLEQPFPAAQATRSLGLSERHVWWLLARLRGGGRAALVHGNRGQPSGRRLPAATQQANLEKLLGQKVLIDYKVGGSGALGWRELVKARPDGHLIAGINILLWAPHGHAVLREAEWSRPSIAAWRCPPAPPSQGSRGWKPPSSPLPETRRSWPRWRSRASSS